MRLRLPTNPVRQWCDYVGCDYQEGEVVLEEGAAEDHEEEADCQYLREVVCVSEEKMGCWGGLKG